MKEKLEELLEKLKKGDLDKDQLKDLQEEFNDLAKDVKDNAELKKLLGNIGEIAGGLSSGMKNANPELAIGAELGKILGPLITDLIKRLVSELLKKTEGYKVRKAADDEEHVEKLKKTSLLDFSDADDDFPPKAYVKSNSIKSECKGEEIKVTFTAIVIRREEHIKSVNAKAIGINGNFNGDSPVIAGETKIKGKDGKKKLALEEEQKKGKPIEIPMELLISCAELYDNLGAFILRVVVTDKDGNIYIYHTRLNLRKHLLQKDCCGSHTTEDLKKGLIDKVKKNSGSFDKKALKDLIERIEKSGSPEDKTPIAPKLQPVLPVEDKMDMNQDEFAVVDDSIELELNMPNVNDLPANWKGGLIRMVDGTIVLAKPVEDC